MSPAGGRRAARGGVLLAFVVALIASYAGIGTAATQGRIVSIVNDNGKLQIVFGGVGLPEGVAIDPSSVKVTANGTQLDSSATTVSESTETVRRTAVLDIDTSGSMAGEGINGAKAAANAFLNELPDDVYVGLVTFSSKAQVRVPATLDRPRVRSEIAKLTAAGNTALYDSVPLSLRTAGSAGGRSVLILSDGNDDGSSTTLKQATAAAKRSKASVNAVAFRTQASTNVALRAITGVTGGQVVSATEASDLSRAFTAAAQDIAREIVITAPVPDALAGQSATIVVTADAGGETISDQVFAAIPKNPVRTNIQAYGPQAVDDSGGISSVWAALAIALLFVAFVVILGVAIVSAGGRERQEGVRRRLSVYTLTGRGSREHDEQQASAIGQTAIARSAVDLAGRVVQTRDFETGLTRRLEAAGLPLRPAEWLLLHVGFALLLSVVLLILTGGSLLAAIIGVVVGVLGPLVFLNIKEERRRSAFLSQLPDTLQLLAGSLSAGYSLPQGVDAVVKEGNPAVASEFNRALVEARLGMPIEDALEGIAHRMRSEDFAWVVMAIRIQREVGGNLAEVLNTVAETLRERERIRRQVDVLSAEGRLSALILGSLPILFGLYLLTVRREYLEVLWEEPAGVALLVLAGVLLGVGILWLRKVIKVDV